jgi:hypothetical protein
MGRLLLLVVTVVALASQAGILVWGNRVIWGD